AIWSDGSIYGGTGGDWINKIGSIFTILNDNDGWFQQAYEPGPAPAFTIERGALLVKDANANDVGFYGPLNVAGDFNILNGTISGFGGGNV
ncbi:hypothetical protein NL529_28930, partial [Klebsiella pneumoniae]|nr:hypothetical protein [Klebsiella pneumoniae]